MKILKMTLLFRSYDSILAYEKSGDQPFWKAFCTQFSACCPDFAFEKLGQMQGILYFPVNDDDVSSLEQQVKEILDRMDAAKDTLFFVKDLSQSEYARLKEQNIDNILSRDWFRKALEAGKATPAEEKRTEEKPPEEPKQKKEKKKPAPDVPDLPERTDEWISSDELEALSSPASQAPGRQPSRDAQTEEEPVTLAQEAEKIAEFKKKLLRVVHGQNHAVDAVTKALFESDAFAAGDESRKTPLATFLFCGPSGVGKTLLAKTCSEFLGVTPLFMDMSEYSNNLSCGKFNGEHGEPAIVTDYVRKNPHGIIIFDEIEKAHINTIHLFLQILDEGFLTDFRLKTNVYFRDITIFITTNAGHSLYDDPTLYDLSGVSRRVILEALRTDVNPSTGEPYFPECITTRFANGNVVLFNHLEPFALTEILEGELVKQAGLFEKSFGVKIHFDQKRLAALAMYSAGGTADARTLRGIARSLLVKEVLDAVLQTYTHFGTSVNALRSIQIVLDENDATPEAAALFAGQKKTRVIAFSEPEFHQPMREHLPENVELLCFDTLDECKAAVRGVVDFVLLDPECGRREMARVPNDIEDVRSDGMDLFRYLQEFESETPIYLLDSRKRGAAAFGSLLSKGARGVVDVDLYEQSSFDSAMKLLSFGAHINNAAFQLARSGKALTYSSSQYTLDDETVIVSFDHLSVGIAPSSLDKEMLAPKADDQSVRFSDVTGCKKAKEALQSLADYIADPRKAALEGKRAPKGVLLYGPPGTGKTMLAKAMANEAGAAFFPITATSFFSPYVGQSEINIRELFRKARKYAPAIIFIDEVDAIARKRTGSEFTHHNEDALNALIAEMDGFSTDPKRPVFLIAATNYSISGSEGKVLDEAFVRRFNERVYVGLPDADERYEFLLSTFKKHGVTLVSDHEGSLRRLADRSGGLSNADLSTIVTNFLNAHHGGELTGKDLMDALDGFRFGEVNKFSPESLRQTACHESGHALVHRLLGQTPSFLTVVSRGDYGGFMEFAEDETKTNFTYAELLNKVCCALAGRAAEMLVYGEEAGLNTGASSDIRSARRYIQAALDEYAMGEFLYRKSRPLDAETLMREQFDRAKTLLRQHLDALTHLTDLLQAQKSLDKKMLEDFFAAESL